MENEYNTRNPHRHNEVQASFVNDVYGDGNQIGGQSTFWISAVHAIYVLYTRVC